jgi:uncharacterized delta-60 repeat protein
MKTVLTITSAMLLTVLAACSSNTPTPIVADDQASLETTGFEVIGPGPIAPINCNSFVLVSKLDNCFGKSGKVFTDISGFNQSHLNDQANAVRVQADGKIVVAGQTYNGFDLDIAVTRYNSDGSLDATFGTGGKVTTAIDRAAGYNEVANAMAIQSDGKIVVTGSRYSTDNLAFLTVRYNTNGSLDTSFGYQWVEWFDRTGWRRIKMRTPGYALTSTSTPNYTPTSTRWVQAQTIGIQSDGKIVIAGRNLMFRYTDDGGPDDTFAMAAARDDYQRDYINALVIQPDGKILAAGQRSRSGYWLAFLTRYNPDGSFDTGFGEGRSPYSTNSYSTEVRLDWTVFSAGQPRTFTDNVFNALVIQNDGKILASGWSSIVDPNFPTQIAIARFHPDGTVETVRAVDIKPGSSRADGTGLAIQSNGKILITGTHQNVSNTDFAIARYNTDLSPDTTFGTAGVRLTPVGTGDDLANGVALQTDGKIVVAGSSFNGTKTGFAVVRYRP